MTANSANIPARNTKLAIWRGVCLRCPRCGDGTILHKYLKVNAACSQCGLDLSPARADDGPAYLTILLVGHIAGFLLHFVWVTWYPTPFVMASSVTAICVALSLFLLPRFKGLIIAVQWAKRMHGF